MTKIILLFLLFFSFSKAFSQVFISDFRVVPKDSSVKISPQIKLSYQENHIAISFADTTDKDGVFEYQLENQDLEISKKDFFKAKDDRSITYVNMFGGEYIFRVKNTHNGSETSISFTIELLFWQNWWFIPMMFFYALIVVAIIIYLILLYRFRQQNKLQKVRNDIASDLHDDIGATLSSISFFGEMLRNKVQKNAPADEVLPLLEKVISTSKETIQTMRGVVWTINPNNDIATDFFQKLHTFGKEMLASKDINLNFEATGFENLKLPLDTQRNLFLFYKECINNIAKHSECEKVDIEITPLSFGEGRGMTFFGQDNGKGFNINELHEGHGLRSLRKRADELQGNLEIKSTVGQGTSILLTFPLD